MSADLFWQALVQAEHDIRQMEIRPAMQAINQLLEPHFPGLAAELQGTAEPGVYQLILTAHGAIDHFEDVMTLQQRAPSLAMFSQITAFRARANLNEMLMSMDNFSLSPADIRVAYYADAGRVGLQLWFTKPIPHDMQDHARNMSFILLDHALGEYDFAIKIGPLDFMDTAPAPDAMKLHDLPARLDSFWRDELGHNASYPLTEHEWQAFELISDTDPDDKILLQRNVSATSLVGRADMLWRLQITVTLKNQHEFELLNEFEEQLSSTLSQNQLGIASHISLYERVRSMNWQVNERDLALKKAQQLTQHFASLDFAISSEFDPQWQDYLRWQD